MKNRRKVAYVLSVLALMAGNALAGIIEFNLEGQAGAGLLSGNELGVVSGSPGSGNEVGVGIQFDDVSKILSVNVGWGTGNGFLDLTGAATASHIHGPATQLQNAGVVIDLGSGLTASASNGGIVFTSVALSGANETSLLSGLLYINVHTGTNGGGEIRGNIVAIPEPSTLLLIGLAGGSLIVYRRKLRR